MDLALPHSHIVGLEQLEADCGPRLLKTAVCRAKLERLALRGLTAKDAAGVVGISPQTAQKHYRDSAFRQATLRMLAGTMQEADIGLAGKYLSWSERLEQAADKSFERLMEMLDNVDTDPAIATRIAQDFLDRNPDSGAKGSTLVRHAHTFSADDLAHAANVAAEIGRTQVINIRKTA